MDQDSPFSSNENKQDTAVIWTIIFTLGGLLIFLLQIRYSGEEIQTREALATSPVEASAPLGERIPANLEP